MIIISDLQKITMARVEMRFIKILTLLAEKFSDYTAFFFFLHKATKQMHS